MKFNLTPAILEELHKEGYQLLIDKGRISQSENVFTPIKESLDNVEVDKEKDAVLSIEDAKSLPFDELSNHKVILPDVY